MRNRFICIILMIGLSLCLLSQEQIKGKPGKNNHYRIPKVDSKINTDGILDEEVWKKALVLKLEYEVNPGENIPPPVQTDVLLAYNKTHLFIAFRAYDPEPSKIRARLSDRDNLGTQDWVAVVLDTFDDDRRSFDLFCNPLGIQTDSIGVSNDDASQWDAIWDSGGKINAKGYFVEMSVPFSSLRFQRKDGDQVWGFDAVRSYPRNVRHHIGAFPHDRNNNCYLCQSIKLIGFQGVKSGKNLEFDPTLVGYLSKARESGNSGPFIKDKKLEPGITAKWGFTPNLTFSATANPDFSQVEADALKLDINKPFALYYSEKRPFFTEGSDFFNSPLNIVYTRTIRAPSWGLKLTGKEDKNTIGAYFVRDTLTNLIFPGTQYSNATSMPLNSTATVLRYRRDIGNKYTIGAHFTNREGDDYYNRVLSVDGNLRLTSKDQIQFQIIGSATRYPDEVALEFDQQLNQFNDKAFKLFYYHNTRNLDCYAGYNDIGKNFRADLGFIPQAGYRCIYTGLSYLWIAKPRQWWTEFMLEGDYQQDIDHSGELLMRKAHITFKYRGPLNMFSLFNFEYKRESYNGLFFDQKQLFIHHRFKPNGNMIIYHNFLLGDRIDYANTRLGKRFWANHGIQYNIGLHLRLTLDHTLERMRVNSQRLYNAHQGEMRLTYQFNKRMFLRGILQYVDYRFNNSTYINEVDPVYRNVFTQILFSYKINPQTVLYLGYTDKYTGFNKTNLPLTDRKLFLKIGYALVM